MFVLISSSEQVYSIFLSETRHVMYLPWVDACELADGLASESNEIDMYRFRHDR
jgi:hypothetical protein